MKERILEYLRVGIFIPEDEKFQCGNLYCAHCIFNKCTACPHVANKTNKALYEEIKETHPEYFI